MEDVQATQYLLAPVILRLRKDPRRTVPTGSGENIDFAHLRLGRAPDKDPSPQLASNYRGMTRGSAIGLLRDGITAAEVYLVRRIDAPKSEKMWQLLTQFHG